MIIIVGLGNPGSKYANSRHSLGFMVLDKLAKEMLPLEKTKWQFDKKTNALILRVSPEIFLIKPQTFMNASGFSVKSLITQLLITNYSSLWLVHDDVDLPLGKLKIRFGGAGAGHHGVESIMEKLGTDKFLRFRLGIGKPIGRQKTENRKRISVEDYVLEDFKEGEAGEVKKMIKKTVEAIKVALKNGPEKAMNRFN